MKRYSKPASREIEMYACGALLSLSLVVGGGEASEDYDVLSNRKGWNSEDWSGSFLDAEE